jgi:hypothetical protein
VGASLSSGNLLTLLIILTSKLKIDVVSFTKFLPNWLKALLSRTPRKPKLESVRANWIVKGRSLAALIGQRYHPFS